MSSLCTQCTLFEGRVYNETSGCWDLEQKSETYFNTKRMPDIEQSRWV